MTKRIKVTRMNETWLPHTDTPIGDLVIRYWVNEGGFHVDVYRADKLGYAVGDPLVERSLNMEELADEVVEQLLEEEDA